MLVGRLSREFLHAVYCADRSVCLRIPRGKRLLGREEMDFMMHEIRSSVSNSFLVCGSAFPYV